MPKEFTYTSKWEKIWTLELIQYRHVGRLTWLLKDILYPSLDEWVKSCPCTERFPTEWGWVPVKVPMKSNNFPFWNIFFRLRDIEVFVLYKLRMRWLHEDGKILNKECLWKFLKNTASILSEIFFTQSSTFLLRTSWRHHFLICI